MSLLLSKIRITNFTSIKRLIVNLADYTPIVGYNNAGKSNILDAIQWLFQKSSLPKSVFNNPGNPVIIEGIVTGITTDILESLPLLYRKKLIKYVRTETLYIQRIQNKPDASPKDIFFNVKSSRKDIWKINPHGIEKAIKELFPEPIQIEAMTDPAKDVSNINKTTTIGKLLKEMIGPIKGNFIANEKNELDNTSNLANIDVKNKSDELKEFNKNINNKINSFFPGIEIKVHVPTSKIDEIFSKGTIKFYENKQDEGRDISSLGHGAQRSIQMALIRHLADMKMESKTNHNTTTLLLIDEPELYLHPQGVEILREAFRDLAGKGYQVILTTHSPFMIRPDDVENTVIILKDPERGTIKRNTFREAVAKVFDDAPSQFQLLFSITNSSYILFSDKVLLCEGKTEERLLPAIIEKITGKSIGLHKIALVAMNSSSNTKKAMDVLQKMDIPVKAVVDLDFPLREGRLNGFIRRDDKDLKLIKSKMSKIARTKGIKLKNGWPTNRKSSMSASMAIATLATEPSIQVNIKNIKNKMLKKNVWVWKKGTIENHLGNIRKNEESWAKFKYQIDNNDIKKILKSDFNEINRFVNWLIKD